MTFVVPSEAAQLGAFRAQQATERALKLSAQMPPTFVPAAADIATLATLPSTPAQVNAQFWEKLNPLGAARERQAAIELLSRASGTPVSSASPTNAPPWPPSARVQPRTGMRLQLPLELQPSLASAAGGGGTKDALGSGLQGLAGALDAGFEGLYTAAGYYEWVRMGRYPWWWGPVTGGLLQVEKHLYSDLKYYLSHPHLPPATKQVAEANISKAITWIREQRALSASRVGGPPVAF